MNASLMLVGLSRSYCVYMYVCCWRFLEPDEAGGEKRSFVLHMYTQRTPHRRLCALLSQNYIQVIVFYLLAQTKVIYLHIYINLLTKCLENIPRNTNISNK